LPRLRLRLQRDGGDGPISVSRLDNMLRSPMALHRRRAWLD
jgi:hypothetical protein